MTELRLVQISLLVRDYDEAIQYYTNILGFQLVEDTILSATKRWVVVSPNSTHCTLLLQKPQHQIKRKLLEISREVVCFYFYTLIILKLPITTI